MNIDWFSKELGYPIKSTCNNPTQSCSFEKLTQAFPRVFGTSGTLSSQSEKQLDTILKVLRLCNIYEKHNNAPSEMNEKQKKIYLIEQYYKNPDDRDVDILAQYYSEHQYAAGSPVHDMMNQLPNQFKSKNDYDASKLAHEAHGYVQNQTKLETQISEALKLSPNCIEAYNLLAMYKATNFEEALQYYKEGQSKKDDYYHPINSKLDRKDNWLNHQFRQYFRSIIGEANVLKRMGRYQEALDAYYRVLKLDPEIHGMMVSYCNFQANIPECLMKLGKWKEAYEFMKKNMDILKLTSSKPLLWSLALCDYIVNKRSPQYNSVEDQIKYAERSGSSVNQDTAILKSPISVASQWCPYVYEYLLGIRKLPFVGFPRSFSSQTAESPNLGAEAQYVADHLDLWLSNPDALEYAIKNANIINSHFALGKEEFKLKRKHFDSSNPTKNFFQLYSKLYFPGARAHSHLYLLHRAVEIDNLEAVKLLVEHGAPILTTHEPNPFHFACYYDHSREIVKFFCEKTVNPLRSNTEMPNPLGMAVNQGNWKPMVEILSYLLKKKMLVNETLLSTVEGIFGTSVYECLLGLEKCQRCLSKDHPHSKDASFEKCIDALFLFGMKISKKEILCFKDDMGSTPKDSLIKHMIDRCDGSVFILPRSLEITDPEVLDLLSKMRNISPSTNKTDSSNQPEESPEDLKNKGNEEFKKGACMKALDFYNKALKHTKCPSTLKPILYSNMSACFYNLKHFERALACADDSIKADNNFVKGYYRKAMSLEALKRTEEAMKVVKIAIEKDPDNESLVTLFKKLKQQISEKKDSDFEKFEKSAENFEYFKEMFAKEGNDAFANILEKLKEYVPKEDLEYAEKIGDMLDDMIKKCLSIIDKKFTPHRREIYSYLKNMPKDQRLKQFEGCLTKVEHNDKWFTNQFRNIIIDVDLYSKMMDSIIYLDTEKVKISELIDPTGLISKAHHMAKVKPLFSIMEQSSKQDVSVGCWTVLLYTIQFLMTLSAEVYKKWERTALNNMSKERKKAEEVKELATIYSAKKKKHCPMCPRIDDEKFSLVALTLEFNYKQYLTIVESSESSLKEKQDAFNYISKCEDHVFELITEKNQLEALRQFVKTSPDSAFETLANIFAVPHVKPEYIEKALHCVDILEKDGNFINLILSFGSTAKSMLSPSLCRFIANSAFVSDKLGCMLEPLLPSLYHTIQSTFDIDREILPDLNSLRAVASLSTIPNLKRSLHCLGFAHLIYQIQIHPFTSKLDPLKAGMATTAKDWMSSGEKARVTFTSKFDASKKISQEERRQLFAATSKFALNELPPIQPSLKERIKQQGLTKGLLGKFVVTVADGYGIFRIVRVDNIGGDYVISCLLFNVYTQVVRDQLATTFATTKQSDNFLKSYLGSTRQFRPYKTKYADEQFTSFATIPDNVALDITESAINETLRIRPLSNEEEDIIRTWAIMFGRPNLGKQRNTRTVYEVLWANISDLKQPPHTPLTFRFYREIFCTPFFHNYYFAVAEKIDFGFMPAFETITNLNIQSIHDMVPLPSEAVMDWIVCMCDVIDHVPEAKKFLVNIFTYSAYYFKMYGNIEIASDIYQSLKKWRDGSTKAINIPFIRAFVERSLYFDGREMLPDAMLTKIFKTYGLEHAINTALENSRSKLPARLVPRNHVFTEISKGIAKWCTVRKGKGKKPPNLKTFFEKLVPLIAKHPEVGELVASLLISMSHEKLSALFSAVWSEISAEKLDIATPQDIFEIDALRMSFVKQEREQLSSRPTKPKIEKESEKEPFLPSAIASISSNEIKPEKKAKKVEKTPITPQTSSSSSPETVQKKPEEIITTPVISQPEIGQQTNQDLDASKSYECASCGKPNSKKKCGACQAVVYCSKECQAKHWKVHKPNCKK